MFRGPREHALIPRGSHCQSSGETRRTQMVKRSKEIRDGPLENLWGGRAKYKKNIRARVNEMKKNSCTPINPKKYSCYGLKKIHTRNLITKKNSCGSKIPLPPHNLSNGPALRDGRRGGEGNAFPRPLAETLACFAGAV